MCCTTTKPIDLYAVIPAAGLGTRFLPVSHYVPKEMLPLGSDPAIGFVANEFKALNLQDLSLVINQNKLIVADFVKQLLPNMPIRTVLQPQPLGLGHAVMLAMQRQTAKNGLWLVALPDNLFFQEQPLWPELLAIFEKRSDVCAVVLLVQVPQHEASKYGMVTGKSIGQTAWVELTQLVEKPDPKEINSDLAIMGRYILSDCVLAELKQLKKGVNGELQLSDALNSLLKLGKKVLGLKIQAPYFDVGIPKGLLAANIFWQK